jgi:hypothetical protein
MVRCFTDLDTTPQAGHAEAAGSTVTTCTIRLPSGSQSTRTTRTPTNPNNFVVASDTPLVSFSPETLRNVQTSEGPRAKGQEDRIITTMPN